MFLGQVHSGPGVASLPRSASAGPWLTHSPNALFVARGTSAFTESEDDAAIWPFGAVVPPNQKPEKGRL